MIRHLRRWGGCFHALFRAPVERGPSTNTWLYQNSLNVIAGMIIGTAFTLFLVPAIYTLVAKSRVKVAEEESEGAGELAAAPVAATTH